MLSRMGSSFAHACKKLRYLTSNPDFPRFKVRTLSRLFRWRLHCALNIPAIVDLPNGMPVSTCLLAGMGAERR